MYITAWSFPLQRHKTPYIDETTKGLRSGYKFLCDYCEVVWSEEDRKTNVCMDVNTAAVLGTMSIGSGFTGLQEVFGAMDICYL